VVTPVTTLVTTSRSSDTSNPYTNKLDLDDLDAGGRIYTGGTRLRALWTDWSMGVRVFSGALGKAPLVGAFFRFSRPRRSCDHAPRTSPLPAACPPGHTPPRPTSLPQLSSCRPPARVSNTSTRWTADRSGQKREEAATEAPRAGHRKSPAAPRPGLVRNFWPGTTLRGCLTASVPR
jgi:hypothetical protein